MSESLAQIIPDETLQSFDLLRADCALIHLPNYAVVELRGEDRKGWLQGQATNDLKQLDLGASSSFCLCQPTGQIIAVCDIWGLKDRFVLICEAASKDALLQRVDQMVILEDVEARDLTDQVRLLSVQGPNATKELGELLPLPTLDGIDSRLGDSEVTVLRSNRTGLGGWDLLIPAEDQVSAQLVEKRFGQITDEAFEIARLEAGVPRLGKDIDAKTMPPELGPAFEARHVNYRKGCYTGQEVLMRIHSRGHTNRTWVGLSSERKLTEGSSVQDQKGKDIGRVTSACFSPDYGFIGGAMLRNEAALEGEEVSVDGAAAIVRQMPILRFD